MEAIKTNVGRRSLLRGALVLGGVAVTPGLSAQDVFAGPESLSQASMTLLIAVADTLVPATDTPGAVEAGVPLMFSKLLANWAAPATRDLLLGALKAIDGEAGGSGFAALPADRRYELLSSFDKGHAADPAYGRLKDLLVTLYYLTEAGATVELRYEHSPGAWEPSLPVTAETRNPGGPTGL